MPFNGAGIMNGKERIVAALNRNPSTAPCLVHAPGGRHLLEYQNSPLSTRFGTLSGP